MSNPIKPSFKTEWRSGLLILLAVIAGVYFYQNFPDQVPIHWNFQGVADNYGSAALGAFFLPALMVLLYAFFLVLPLFDPRRERYSEFASAYHLMKDVILFALFFIFLIAGLAGLGYPVDISFWVPLMIGVLFVALGAIMRQVKSNWFMGIRTPWTLSSETVWQKTHQLAGKVMALSGVLIAATIFVDSSVFKMSLLAIAILIVALGLPLYSYIIFRQEKKGGQDK